MMIICSAQEIRGLTALSLIIKRCKRGSRSCRDKAATCHAIAVWRFNSLTSRLLQASKIILNSCGALDQNESGSNPYSTHIPNSRSDSASKGARLHLPLPPQSQLPRDLLRWRQSTQRCHSPPSQGGTLTTTSDTSKEDCRPYEFPPSPTQKAKTEQSSCAAFQTPVELRNCIAECTSYQQPQNYDQRPSLLQPSC